MTKKENFLKGIISQNPLFVSILGTCPALAVTTTLKNAIGMGITFTIILITTNVIISLVRKLIPDEVRIPSYIVIIATVVTVVELFMKAYLSTLHSALGIFIALIVVNCNVLGRAEAFASKHNVLDSFIDATGMGIGFTLALTAMGLLREVLGSGSFFGLDFTSALAKVNVVPISILTQPTGAFLTLGVCIWAFNAFRMKLEAKQAEE
ncbi:MAG TPA: electron transport complex subunit RsxE [Haloplasmataceae bacterium]